MGVTGLWTVVQPCARPIKLETLNKKRLAVDASIWIYQFLKAVRDKEGNALRNSHVVGFFRRICKLLFFGIKPVFVFDGGAPVLKRQTISGRKARREGRREDAARTAGKLLAVQMLRRAEEQDERRRREVRERREGKQRDDGIEEELIPENLVYVEELQMDERERQKNRTFKKKDAYHLPQLDVSLAEMGAPNDPRIMSQDELEDYARQFYTGEDINLYDFSKIDFNSSFFQSLPGSDRYNILNAARLRSRLRMGYSKEQLDEMFPDRMAFSKFQIERVRERNDLTQRLMNLSGMNGDDFGSMGRIAGEKGKEYVLVKNDGVEGGWALGVVTNKNEGQQDQPIDVESLSLKPKQYNDDEDWDDDGFVDVPIEGLNRLPKPSDSRGDGIDALRSAESIEARKAFYNSRRNDGPPKTTSSLRSEVGDEDKYGNREDPDALFLPPEPEQQLNDDEDMDELFEDVLPLAASEEDDEELQRAIAMSLENRDEEAGSSRQAANEAAMLNVPRIDRPLDFNERNSKVGRAFAQVANNRAQAEFSGNTSNKSHRPAPKTPVNQPIPSVPKTSSGFSGPLPFEALDIGKSFLRPKKKPEQEGGFEKEDKKKKPQSLPPWFSGDVRKGNEAQKAMADRQSDVKRPESMRNIANEPILQRQETNEVTELDNSTPGQDELIEVESSGGASDDSIAEEIWPLEKKVENELASNFMPADAPIIENEVPMGDVAETVRAEPLPSSMPQQNLRPGAKRPETQHDDIPEGYAQTSEQEEWSESDTEKHADTRRVMDLSEPVGGDLRAQSTKSSSPEFEDLDPSIVQRSSSKSVEKPPVPSLAKENTFDQLPADTEIIDEDDMYSDPEDEELMVQLAKEAEEHARFASELNARSQLQNADDYERELKQLRSQQKKDRRDADEVSQIMVTECQQLLQLFGIPYITAPMEAEAQCAELVSLGLVDGIVTDDSDIFLFGGTRVYKNMFNQGKFVECYLSSDLEKEYSLTRTKVIQIAHLLGSDYTEGLPSVGPVTALEILSQFPDLDAFKAWWTGVQSGSVTAAADAKIPFRRKFRKNATKLFLPPSFPDPRVDEAYLHPDVDSGTQPFQWGVPDLDRLRAFLMATIGWSQERADEILVPVIRDMNRREKEGTQANITQFFEGAVGSGARQRRGAAEVASAGAAGDEGFAPRRRNGGKSRRMETALGRLHEQATGRTHGEEDGLETGGSGEEAPDAGAPEAPRKGARPRKRAKASGGAAGDDEDGGDGDGEDGGYHVPPPKKAARRGRAKARGR